MEIVADIRAVGQLLGGANAYTEIFEANRDQLSDPEKVKPGQVLEIPQYSHR